MICEFLIAQDIAASCANVIRPGVEPVGYIINKADIDSYEKTGNIVDLIVLKTGKRAYQIQQLGRQPFNGTSVELQEGDFFNAFNKVVSFIVLDNSPVVSKDVIEPLANGEFVVIIENKYRDDSAKNAFEVIGLETGAKATSIAQNKYENLSGWTVELTESETPVANVFFWDDTYESSREKLENLLTPAV